MQPGEQQAAATAQQRHGILPLGRSLRARALRVEAQRRARADGGISFAGEDVLTGSLALTGAIWSVVSEDKRNAV